MLRLISTIVLSLAFVTTGVYADKPLKNNSAPHHWGQGHHKHASKHHRPRRPSFLSGLQEVPLVISSAVGRFYAKAQGDSISWKVRIKGLDSDVQAMHLHLGKSKTNGGVVVALCENSPADRGATIAPACNNRVQDEFVADGIIRSETINALPEQGFDAGNLRLLVRAMRAKLVYLNVHTTNHPSGELRGVTRIYGRLRTDHVDVNDKVDDGDDSIKID